MTSVLKINLKKFLVVLGFVILILVIFLSGYKAANFFKFYKFSTKPIISSFSVEQLPLTPGQPIRWVKAVSISSITDTQHLLAIPKDATGVKISTTTAWASAPLVKGEMKRADLVKLAIQNAESEASQAFAKRVERETKPGFWASLSRSLFKSNTFFATVSEVTMEAEAQTAAEVTLVDLAPMMEEAMEEPADAEDSSGEASPADAEDSSGPLRQSDSEASEAMEEIVVEDELITEEIVEEVVEEPADAPESSGEAMEEIATTTEEVASTTEEIVEEEVIATTTEEDIVATTTEDNSNTNSGGGGGGSDSSTPVVENSEILTTGQATTTATSTDLVVVEYETPAPVIAEAVTDTGKIVSVSSDSEQEVITNVLAFTTIPEIFKVGQEDKIKIKWTNNGDQNVTFNAYDTDGNGKLDYVEWTVPHLSEQIFEIIFISKAFELNTNLEIINDIYEAVFEKDDVWVTIPDTHTVRVTFEQILSARNDNTIYAKPTSLSSPATIEVYPVYTDELGNVTRGSLLTTFPDITEEKQYRVLLTGLDTPTDMFDLKVVGGDIDFDYIVDPTCPNSMAGTGVLGDECQITSWADLDSVRTGLTLDYKLTADLSSTTPDYTDLGDDWTPIGTDWNTPFTGNFDGQGNTISDLIINLPEEYTVGLFGYAEGDISNVNLNVDNVTGSGSVGGLVGYLKLAGVISNSSATVLGTVYSGGDGAGGLVGVNYGTISNSYSIVSGSVSASPSSYGAGGLVGYGDGNIFNSYSIVSGNITTKESVGGLIGWQFSGTISNSYSIVSGNVSANTYYAGGLAGSVGGTISNSSAIVDTFAIISAPTYVGFMGRSYGTVTNSYLTIRNTTYGNITFNTWNVGNSDGGNLLDEIQIGQNSAFVDGTILGLNKPATTTLTNTGITGGTVILKDGVACGDCVLVSSDGDDYTFTVTGWSTYSIQEPTNTIPNIPVLISPANSTTTADNTPTLSANYSDPDTGDTGWVNYRISTSSLPDCVANTNVVAWGTVGETTTNNEATTYTVSAEQELSSDGTYYWCAQNDDGVLTSDWTGMGNFILDTTPPTLSITTPDEGETYSAATWSTPAFTCDDGGSGCATGVGSCQYAYDDGSVQDLSYVSEIGSQGTGNDQFNYPYGITTDGYYFYILDTYNNRLVKRNLDLTYHSQIGSRGTGDDQFKDPNGITTDGTYLYISDTYNNRLVKRNLDLTYHSKIGSGGSGDDQFNRPSGITTDGTYLYILDFNNHRLVKRNLDLTYHSQIGTQGTGNDQFNYPFAITTDGIYLYVIDYFNGRLVKRNLDLSYVSQIGSSGSGDDQFDTPRGITTDDTYLYIVDTANNRLVKRNLDLTYHSQIGSEGSGDDQFVYPRGITTDGTYLYILDTDNHRLVKRAISPNYTDIDCSNLGSDIPAPDADGSFTLYVKGKDVANNWGSATPIGFTYDTTPPTQSNWSPATTTTLTTKTPTITFNLNEAGDCFASTTDLGYDDMVSGGGIDCTENGLTMSCQLTDLGANGTKNIYISCADYPAGNKDSNSTNTDLTYTLSVSSGGGVSTPACLYDNPDWSTCVNSKQTRTLTAINQTCQGESSKTEEQDCVMPPPPTATTTYPLTINSVNGTVTKNPDQVLYDEGTVVSLLASPDLGYLFSTWTGNVSSTTATSTTVTMNATTTLTANFILLTCPETQFVNALGQCENKPDLCLNISGIQIDIPAGQVRTTDGRCVVDMCPNIEAIQETVPVDKIIDGRGNCVPKLADVCSNIDGIQDSVPAGKILVDGACLDAPTDFCANIPGLQTSIPAGMIVLDGECVYSENDVCPNISGVQTSIPAGRYINNVGDCVQEQMSDGGGDEEEGGKSTGGGNNKAGETVTEKLIAILDVSTFVTDKVAVLGTTTQEIVLGAQKVLESRAGDAVAKTITTAGVIGGGVAVTGALALNGVVVTDLLFLPFKLWGLLLSVLGLKKRNRPWGTVYDSVTKQPIDPAYVMLKNLETGKEEMSITDLDGRYGFLVPPGKYTISANKTNYAFPSKKLLGKTEDILYNNLYFGEEMSITDPSVLLSKNIPLDPLNFDWNEFTKGQKKLMKFYSQREKVIRIITDWIFRIGFLISLVSLFLVSAPYNLIIFGLYLVLYALRKIGLKQKAVGSLTDKEGVPLSYAIVRVFDAELKVEVTHKVANQVGKYYCLVNKGKYYVKIEKKSGEESYEEVFTSPVFEANEGIVNQSFVIS